MGKFVHVTADRVRNGMRGLEKLAEKDEAWEADRKAQEEDERRLREQWERARRADLDTGKGM
jgi:hypothetical protein